jgi:hypothetical protein
MNQPIDPRRIELLDPEVVAILKTKTPAEKLAMAFDSNKLVRLRLAGHFRTLHPDWTDAEVDAAIARRVLNGSS